MLNSRNRTTSSTSLRRPTPARGVVAGRTSSSGSRASNTGSGSSGSDDDSFSGLARALANCASDNDSGSCGSDD